MSDAGIAGTREFTDGTTRPVFVNEGGEFVIGDDNERVYGTWRFRLRHFFRQRLS
jgi:hypothetical protein